MTNPRDVTEPFAYAFDADHGQHAEDLLHLLGGKGAGLALMTAMGLPVPPGFTMTTAACRAYLSTGWSQEHESAVLAGLAELEIRTGKRLGDRSSPLLLSIRSGAADSMPGMMDTVLDVGMNDEVAEGLARLTGDEAFAVDTHRRAMLSYAAVVHGAGEACMRTGSGIDDVAELQRHLADHGATMPTSPADQVNAVVRAVFDSWRSDRAVRYRQVEGLDDDGGTAVTVQAMVFGNLGDDSGTGVAFSRDPSSGRPGLMGDFLAGAQGEDVVAGGHRTLPLAAMRDRWPHAWEGLVAIADRLEAEFADMVDLEFTVERGLLWMLQARRGKRSRIATFRVAIDMAEDPNFPLDRAGAVSRCRPYLDDPPTIASTHSTVDEIVVGSGHAAAPGRAVGVLCLDVDRAVELEAEGVDVVLVRRETSPADVHGMAASVGLVTTLGGPVSHAAVVARSWGLPAVVGASGLTIVDGAVESGSLRVEEGEVVTVDGDTGRLLRGAHAGHRTVAPEVQVIRRWATESPDEARANVWKEPTSASRPASSTADVGFAVLHSLRIKGMATAEKLAAITRLDEEQVRSQLAILVDDGRVRHHEARSMWQLLPEGRTLHARLLADVVADLDLAGLRYEDFLSLNDGFKQLCTDWQVREGDVNDHGDDEYDAAVLDRLVAHHEAAAPVLESFVSVMPWTEPYPERLSTALHRVQAGDQKAFTGVLCDSYHDVWMELHEDLLLTQGIDRGTEGST